VPVEIVRDRQPKTLKVTVGALEFDEAAESASEGPTDGGFGLSLDDLRSETARRLELPDGRRGAVVTRVEPRSPAARAGVRPGDVILEVNRAPVSGATEAAAALREAGEKRVAFLLVWRGRQELFLTMTKPS
jgi:serine protease Do